MKRFVSLFLIFCLVFLLAGCTRVPQKPKFEEATARSYGRSEKTDDTEVVDNSIKVAATKGPGALGMVYLFESIENGKSLGDYSFEILENSKRTAEMVASGELHIASVPLEDALNTYSLHKGKIQVIAITSFSPYYFVELGAVSSKADLETLKGNFYVPSGSLLEPVMNAIFKYSGNKEAQVSAQYTEADIADLITKGRIYHCAISEPLASRSCEASENEHVGLDLSDIWKKMVQDTKYEESRIVSTCVIANSEFLEEHTRDTAVFLKELKTSVTTVNSQPSAPALIVQYGFAADVEEANKAILCCSITCKTKEEMKSVISGFLNVLVDSGQKVTVPEEDFYYTKSY